MKSFKTGSELTTKYNLNPCPDCGEQKLLFKSISGPHFSGPFSVRVRCGLCDCAGELGFDLFDAMKKWNNRIDEDDK